MSRNKAEMRHNDRKTIAEKLRIAKRLYKGSWTHSFIEQPHRLVDGHVNYGFPLSARDGYAYQYRKSVSRCDSSLREARLEGLC